LKTSYFAKYHEADGVSIALKSVSGFRGRVYPDLYPTWDLLNEYKKTGDEKKYIKQYHEDVLSKLDPQKVYNDLKDCVLLCWEKSGKFCHRRIVAKWIEKNIGVEVPEFEQNKRMIITI